MDDAGIAVTDQHVVRSAIADHVRDGLSVWVTAHPGYKLIDLGRDGGFALWNGVGLMSALYLYDERVILVVGDYRDTLRPTMSVAPHMLTATFEYHDAPVDQFVQQLTRGLP